MFTLRYNMAFGPTLLIIAGARTGGAVKRFSIAAICFIFGAVIGPPAVGAFASLFWSTAADTNDAQRVAARLYARTQLNPAAEAIGDQFKVSTCGKGSRHHGAPGEDVLIAALDRYHFQSVRSEYDNLGIGAIQALPTPVLGALDGCVGSSPMSLACLGYVSKIARSATAVPEATKRAWLTSADSKVEAAWCIANPA